MPEITVCVVVHNAADCVALMRESLLHYHPEQALRFHGVDNGSTDGAGEYLNQHFDRVVHYEDNEHRHGICMDDLCREVQTPYTLVTDSDVEFTGDVLGPAIETLEAYACITPTPRYDMGRTVVWGDELFGQQRIDPAFALWRTADLQRLLRYTSWCIYLSTDAHEYWDGGAMLYRFAQCAGVPVLRSSWIWRDFTHFGEVSALWHVRNLPEAQSEGWPEKLAILKERYKTAGEHLAALRQVAAV